MTAWARHRAAFKRANIASLLVGGGPDVTALVHLQSLAVLIGASRQRYSVDRSTAFPKRDGRRKSSVHLQTIRIEPRVTYRNACGATRTPKSQIATTIGERDAKHILQNAGAHANGGGNINEGGKVRADNRGTDDLRMRSIRIADVNLVLEGAVQDGEGTSTLHIDTVPPLRPVTRERAGIDSQSAVVRNFDSAAEVRGGVIMNVGLSDRRLIVGHQQAGAAFSSTGGRITLDLDP